MKRNEIKNGTSRESNCRWLDAQSAWPILLFHWLITLKLVGPEVNLGQLLNVGSWSAAAISWDVCLLIAVLSLTPCTVKYIRAALHELLITRENCDRTNVVATERNPNLDSGQAHASCSSHALLLNSIALLFITSVNLASTLPFSINHKFLELYIALCLVFATGLGRPAFVDYSMIPKLFLTVWVFSAIQKIVHGRFVNGDSFRMAWIDPKRRSELGDALEFIHQYVPFVDVGILFPLFASIVVAAEFGVAGALLKWPEKRILWIGIVGMQIGVWLATGETSFAQTGLSVCMLGRFGPNAPLREWSLLPKGLFFLLLIWPCVHMAAARYYGFSPWRLGGWGMYSTPDYSDEYEALITIDGVTYSVDEVPWHILDLEDVEDDRSLVVHFNSEAAALRLSKRCRELVTSDRRDSIVVTRELRGQPMRAEQLESDQLPAP
jgi:hypothetical protein